MRRLARRAGVRVFRLFARPLADREANAIGWPNIKLRIIQEVDLLPLCADADLDLEQGRIKAAYARGDLCVGAYDHAGLLVGYCWLAFSALPHLDGVWVDFGPEVVWRYKSLVRPSHRGRGIASALYRFLATISSDSGHCISIRWRGALD